MKKIFAIALALVMVLSMASAFASYCTGSFDWTCATSTKYCGQGTVEVVPYVKVNNGCGGFKWEVSECASAVSSEDVFYAVKLTVDANADDEWWNTVKITTSYKGMDLADGTSLTLFNMNKSWKAVKKLITAEDTAASANTFYYDFQAKSWDIVNSTFELANSNVDNVPVKDASKAKVCVTLKAEDPGMDGIVGNYWVEYVEGKDSIPAKAATNPTITYVFEDTAKLDAFTARTGWTLKTKDYGTLTAVTELPTPGALEASSIDLLETQEGPRAKKVTIVNGKNAEAAVAGVVNALVVYTKDPAKGGEPLVTYTIVDGKVREIKHSNVCGADTYDVIKAFFGLEIGTCVDADLIAANFGWKDKVEDCFAWGDKAPYVVDAQPSP